jgi:hypothetical protein
MRGELFDPGGDSLTPISPCAIATIFCPTPPAPAGMMPAGAPTVPGVIAPWSIDANCDCVPAVPVPVPSGAGGVAVAVGATGGARAALISPMRAMTA